MSTEAPRRRTERLLVYGRGVAVVGPSAARVAEGLAGHFARARAAGLTPLAWGRGWGVLDYLPDGEYAAARVRDELGAVLARRRGGETLDGVTHGVPVGAVLVECETWDCLRRQTELFGRSA